MAREATLFEAANGSPVEGYLLLRNEKKNIPPNWIDRASDSRKKREEQLAIELQNGSLDAIPLLRDWELAYQKECFYYGIRVLLELERKGKSEK